MSEDLESFADEHEAKVLAENEEIGRKLRVERLERRRLEQDNQRLNSELTAIETAFGEARHLDPQPGWLKPTRHKGEPKRATLVAPLSDVHAAERVEADEMQGYNAYNLDICEYRLHRYFEKTIKLARDYIAGVRFDGITLALGGDLVSGDIHDELQQTNELSVFDTVMWLAPRLAAGIAMWAEEFPNVHVVSVPGNHGRDSKVPRFKGRSAHNADTMLARILAFKGVGENVTFDIPDSFDTDFQVYGFRFSLEHGDNMRFSGTSEIGAFGPVKRGTLRKSRQRQAEGRPMDYNIVGHFHQYIPAASQGVVMNGSLKGYDEYARGWKFTPEPPQQALLVVSPEYGITQDVAVKVGKRSKEGW
jgi:hypothetical protein